jgi:hypothetical protein
LLDDLLNIGFPLTDDRLRIEPALGDQPIDDFAVAQSPDDHGIVESREGRPGDEPQVSLQVLTDTDNRLIVTCIDDDACNLPIGDKLDAIGRTASADRHRACAVGRRAGERERGGEQDQADLCGAARIASAIA